MRSTAKTWQNSSPPFAYPQWTGPKHVQSDSETQQSSQPPPYSRVMTKRCTRETERGMCATLSLITRVYVYVFRTGPLACIPNEKRWLVPPTPPPPPPCSVHCCLPPPPPPSPSSVILAPRTPAYLPGSMELFLPFLLPLRITHNFVSANLCVHTISSDNNSSAEKLVMPFRKKEAPPVAMISSCP